MEAESGDPLSKTRSQAQELFQASLRRVDPYEAVRHFVRLDGKKLLLDEAGESETVLDLQAFARIFVVGGGKATAPMARAVEDILGERVRKGIINVKYGFGEELLCTELIEAGHPLPDQKGVEGARKILDLLKLQERDLVFSHLRRRLRSASFGWNHCAGREAGFNQKA
jgi:hydroxypyruvate reductase